ncbi:MAG: hypothetical protein JWM11_4372 [Planctomycetaceae bacterium]|nr:hypothetical protein [Planctomycetaceae bacterium]
MNPSARITVTTGPDRGALLEMAEELVQIGRGSDNALILHDPLLDQHQISIMRRGGRHAIFVIGTDEVEVSGTRVPPDQWVWLPQSANVQITRRTTIEFTSLVEVSDADYETVTAAPSPLSQASAGRNGAAAKRDDSTKRPNPGTGAKSDTKSGIKPKPAVARFITDQAGDPLVKLGADGHLPDLELQEGTAAVAQKKPRDEQSNSLMLVVMFVVSVAMSMGMLLINFDTPSSSASQIQVARHVISIFYGNDQVPLEPYQRMLRRASWAHSQGDYNEEKAIYRQVLSMLRAENQNSVTGLTRLPLEVQRKFDELPVDDFKILSGSNADFSEIKRNDDRLARLLSILLSG